VVTVPLFISNCSRPLALLRDRHDSVFVDRSLILSRHIGITNLRARSLVSAWAETKHLVYCFPCRYRIAFPSRFSSNTYGESPIALTSIGLYLPTQPHDNTRYGRLYRH
jgi:hypothetical protein